MLEKTVLAAILQVGNQNGVIPADIGKFFE
jgi:hypothetical protein